MPCFRGVEIAIIAVSGKESTRLPEFPHPDGSSVSFCAPTPNSTKHGSARFLSPRRPPSPLKSDPEPTQLKANPKISVYIPSFPDASFFFHYAFTKSLPRQKYLFFKVYMNGRHIVSWGIDLRKVSSGATYRAFYEPSERYHHKDNGVLLKFPGIESRCFKFVSGPENKSVADDGGLIEVQIFRAEGRKRRAALLGQYRNQEKYGIAMLSDGLLDRPEDTTYYDYLLTDPKDAPYASFRFHYRSWENLNALQLVPPEEFNGSSSRSSSAIGSAASCETERAPLLHARGDQFSFGLDSLDDGVFNDLKSPNTPRQHQKEEQRVASFCLRRPPERPLPERPLPELPRPEEPADEESEGPTQRSRNSSTTSKISITPSLRCYLDGDSFMTDSVELGVAKAVEVILQHDPSSGEFPAPDKEGPPLLDTVSADAASWVSDHASSPPPSPGVNSSLLWSPGNYLAMTGQNLSRMMEHGRREASYKSGPSPKARKILGNEVDDEPDISERRPPRPTVSLTLPEGEWIRRPRTPSPVRRTTEGARMSGMWSPRPRERRSRVKSPAGASRWHNKGPRPSPLRKQENCALLTQEGSSEEDGNWI